MMISTGNAPLPQEVQKQVLVVMWEMKEGQIGLRNHMVTSEIKNAPEIIS